MREGKVGPDSKPKTTVILEGTFLIPSLELGKDKMTTMLIARRADCFWPCLNHLFSHRFAAVECCGVIIFFRCDLKQISNF